MSSSREIVEYERKVVKGGISHNSKGSLYCDDVSSHDVFSGSSLLGQRMLVWKGMLGMTLPHMVVERTAPE